MTRNIGKLKKTIVQKLKALKKYFDKNQPIVLQHVKQ
jgi:hypothetical protein